MAIHFGAQSRTSEQMTRWLSLECRLVGSDPHKHIRMSTKASRGSVSTCSTTEPIGRAQRLSCIGPSEVHHDPAHVLEAIPVELREDLSFEEQPVKVLAREVKKLRNRDIPYVKVLWSNHREREATWELESALQERYPHLFQMKS
uniref:Chromo domain-containing protein n=1 Tax=Ananas comosus var. bracteatus TaxID=296719 RepID=A0A6V7Q8X1_ANACO|nr:unnamed protein product [Ananas comosus var. bracteatus]